MGKSLKLTGVSTWLLVKILWSEYNALEEKVQTDSDNQGNCLTDLFGLKFLRWLDTPDICPLLLLGVQKSPRKDILGIPIDTQQVSSPQSLKAFS